MGKQKTFVFNLEWYEVLQDYPEEVRFELYEAIMRYALSGTITELKPLAKMAFSFVKKEMDYNRAQYEATLEKRSQAGRRGMQSRYGSRTPEADEAPDALENHIIDDSPEDDPAPSENSQEITKLTQANKANNVSPAITKLTQANKANYNVNVNDKKEKTKKESERDQDLKKDFETFRQAYPGRKRGLDPEFSNLRQRYPDRWRQIIPLLQPALDRMKDWEDQAKETGQFIPQPKNLATWINNQCWTDEYPAIRASSPDSGITGPRPGSVPANGVAGSKRPASREAEMERQRQERDALWQEMEQKSEKPDDLIRRYGYDPAKVSFRQVIDSEWRRAHPPG